MCLHRKKAKWKYNECHEENKRKSIKEMYSYFNSEFFPLSLSHSNGNPLIFDHKSQTVNEELACGLVICMLNIAVAAAV